MSVAIRLMRFGKRNRPFYRIVAIEKRRKRDSIYLDKLGYYDPMTEPPTIEINKERFLYWLNNGAEISEGVRKLWKRIKKKLTEKD